MEDLKLRFYYKLGYWKAWAKCHCHCLKFKASYPSTETEIAHYLGYGEAMNLNLKLGPAPIATIRDKVNDWVRRKSVMHFADQLPKAPRPPGLSHRISLVHG